MEVIVLANRGSPSLLRSADLFDKFCYASDDIDIGMGVSGRQEVGTVVHIVSWVTAGLAMLINHFLLLVSMWLCGSAN